MKEPWNYATIELQIDYGPPQAVGVLAVAAKRASTVLRFRSDLSAEQKKLIGRVEKDLRKKFAALGPEADGRVLFRALTAPRQSPITIQARGTRLAANEDKLLEALMERFVWHSEPQETLKIP